MATIGDVAREAGVSRSTVSSVLTGRKFVAPHTRARVEAAIQRLRYTVNTGARALATATTMTLGVVVRLGEADFSPALATYLIALSDAARADGYAVLLLTETDGAAAVRRAIDGRQVDGLILLDVLEADPRLDPIVAADFPAVLVGMPHDVRGRDAVDLDFAAAARLLVDHLADAGHREALFVRWPETHYAAGATYATRFDLAARCRAAERGMGLLPLAMPVGPERVRATLREAIDGPAGPRALLIHNDAAVAMLPFVLGDLGMSAPSDLSVVSLHSAELARLYVLSFTCVESRPDEIASAAVAALRERIAAPGATAVRHLVAPRLDDHGSVLEKH